MAHFVSSKPAEKSASYLYTVKQKVTESLREYVTRFNKAYLEIQGLNEAVAVEAMKQGVLPDGAFFDSISKVKNITLDQIREKAQKYIRQEETRSSRKGSDNVGGSTRGDFARRGWTRLQCRFPCGSSLSLPALCISGLFP